jgi:hypothetical protein
VQWLQLHPMLVQTMMSTRLMMILTTSFSKQGEQFTDHEVHQAILLMTVFKPATFMTYF